MLILARAARKRHTAKIFRKYPRLGKVTDPLTAKQRSFCMSQIKGRNTKPELMLRRALWRCGLRYRLNSRLPGKPDIVFVQARVAVFVDGCFWHRCEQHFVAPKRNAAFWQEKIAGNVSRDKRIDEELESNGWAVVRIWEHALKDDLSNCVRRVSETVTTRTQCRPTTN